MNTKEPHADPPCRVARIRPMVALLVVVCFLLSTSAPVAQSPDVADNDDSGSTSADALARRVVEATGDPYAVDRLAFTFVVEVDGEQKIERRHVWRPKRGTLEVRNDGSTVQLRRLDDHELSKAAEAPDEHAETWSDVAPDADPAAAAEAWKWFINDSYWLLAPAKLMDSGVHRELDDRGRLVLTFGEVGLTPDDRYALTIDRDTNRVTKWAYTLGDGREGSFRWTDYRQFGPLELSTRRISTGGDRDVVIRFEEVDAE